MVTHRTHVTAYNSSLPKIYTICFKYLDSLKRDNNNKENKGKKDKKTKKTANDKRGKKDKKKQKGMKNKKNRKGTKCMTKIPTKQNRRFDEENKRKKGSNL